jgi:hypothetical protein
LEEVDILNEAPVLSSNEELTVKLSQNSTIDDKDLVKKAKEIRNKHFDSNLTPNLLK